MLIRTLKHFLVEPFSGQVVKHLTREVVGQCETLLDVGCGYASPVAPITARLRHTVGVDAFEPYLWQSEEKGIHHEYRCLDVMALEDHFPPASFDCVVALDLIEHLEKEQGLELLRMMEGVARRKVIVFTPNGFLPQTGYDGNALQEHLSGWSAQEMRERGYRVYGVHGWKRLRGERGRARWKPAPFWEMIALWSHPWFVNRPERAFQILCIKDLDRD